MRKIAILLLLLVVMSVPASASTARDSYINTVVAIAWMEGDTLNVALGNDANSRSTIIISTDARDSRSRPVFDNRRVNVPGRTIVIESFNPSTPHRNEKINVVLTEGRRSVEVPVQQSDIMQPNSYVVQANSEWEVRTDLARLMDDSPQNRLYIDDFYQVTSGSSRGRINVTTFEGGFKYNRSDNSIEYTRPYMVLNMRTPQTNSLVSMTFNMRKVEDGSRWRDEEIHGPTILVYGRNYRVSGSSSGGSGIIFR